jgi:Protein of unknown function (DUF2842)
MRQRQRKLIGSLAILAFVPIYVLIAGAFADRRFADAGEMARLTYFVIAGLAWIVPIIPLIRWMEGPKSPPPA